MARQYRLSDYVKVVEKYRAKVDRPAITTDIIAGFPGETEAEFDQTVKAARDVGFAKMHIFPFSLRRGTAAERLPGHLPRDVVKQRSLFLGKLDQDLQARFRRQFVGERVGVIVEKDTPPSGRCERYFMVTIRGVTRISRGTLVYGTLMPDGHSARLEHMQ
jgi:threonylcarbamoyladenosine tRNA methylthiotransferase MtaB